MKQATWSQRQDIQCKFFLKNAGFAQKGRSGTQSEDEAHKTLFRHEWTQIRKEREVTYFTTTFKSSFLERDENKWWDEIHTMIWSSWTILCHVCSGEGHSGVTGDSSCLLREGEQGSFSRFCLGLAVHRSRSPDGQLLPSPVINSCITVKLTKLYFIHSLSLYFSHSSDHY